MLYLVRAQTPCVNPNDVADPANPPACSLLDVTQYDALLGQANLGVIVLLAFACISLFFSGIVVVRYLA